MARKERSKAQSAKTSSGKSLRKISQNELEVILAEHNEWLSFMARVSISNPGYEEFIDSSGGESELDVDELVRSQHYPRRWTSDEVRAHYRRIEMLTYGCRADLSYTDLSGMNLSGKNLSKALLSGAKLHYTNFERANLMAAHLEKADLRHGNLFAAHLFEVNLEGADLRNANFHSASLGGANLNRADMRQANLYASNLTDARLTGAKLQGATMSRANLERASLYSSDLGGADLRGSLLLNCDLRKANLTNCEVFGVSAWNVQLDGATETQLRIQDGREAEIMVDSLEVAQFIYLLLSNERIKRMIDTVTSKVVLILGRFKPERKKVLDAIREKLRDEGYVPVLFDFERSPNLDFTESITLLARMARFVIADLTEPSSIPQELQAIVPDVAVPVQPILEGEKPYSMFKDYRKYDWILKLHRYNGLEELLASLKKKVIAPAEAKRKVLTRRKNEPPE